MDHIRSHATLAASGVGTFYRVALRGLLLTWSLTACAVGGQEDKPPAVTSERTALQVELRECQEELAELSRSPQVAADRWADAQIFVKGVQWALDFAPESDAPTVDLIKYGLRRARERMASLRSGEAAWGTQRGRVARAFISQVDGSVQPYGMKVPAGYDPQRPMRLDVVLHGSTRVSGLGELQFLQSYDGETSGDKSVPDQNYLEVFPMGRLGENAYRFEGETDVWEAIEAACRNYAVDRRRIVLRGASLGGVGTWRMGLTHPHRFAALGPTAGPVDTVEFARSPWPHFLPLNPVTGWQKQTLHLMDAIDYTANASMIPVVAAMGDQDPYYSSHLLIQKAFENEAIPFAGIVDTGAGHSVTEKAKQRQLQMLADRIGEGVDPAPRKIRFVTWSLKYSRCHWLEVLGLDQHYQRAELKAELEMDGSVAMEVPLNVSRFALYPPALGNSTASLAVGNRPVVLPSPRPDPSERLVFERHDDGSWHYRDSKQPDPVARKQPGLQGPMDDAFSQRFLCVRGTGQPWHPQVHDWAEANLHRFAYEWRWHYRGDLPIKDDVDVTPEDLRSAHLILFGDPGSNLWIGRMLPDIPIKWSRETIHGRGHTLDASDHGLQLIMANPLPEGAGRYVVFNSGHTYHAPDLRLSYMVYPLRGDWALVKVGRQPPPEPLPVVEETLVDSGFFNEHWK